MLQSEKPSSKLGFLGQTRPPNAVDPPVALTSTSTPARGIATPIFTRTPPTVDKSCAIAHTYIADSQRAAKGTEARLNGQQGFRRGTSQPKSQLPSPRPTSVALQPWPKIGQPLRPAADVCMARRKPAAPGKRIVYVAMLSKRSVVMSCRLRSRPCHHNP